jgi:hypothetical protein
LIRFIPPVDVKKTFQMSYLEDLKELTTHAPDGESATPGPQLHIEGDEGSQGRRPQKVHLMYIQLRPRPATLFREAEKLFPEHLDVGHDKVSGGGGDESGTVLFGGREEAMGARRGHRGASYPKADARAWGECSQSSIGSLFEILYGSSAEMVLGGEKRSKP